VLDLVRDVLDKQLLDAEDRPFGKVDGIVLELRDGEPPRVKALEVGAAVRLARLPRRIARWSRPLIRRAHATRIPTESVVSLPKDIKVDIDATKTSAWRIERWLAKRIFAHLPWGR
jgi:hypothetical protein